MCVRECVCVRVCACVCVCVNQYIPLVLKLYHEAKQLSVTTQAIHPGNGNLLYAKITEIKM